MAKYRNIEDIPIKLQERIARYVSTIDGDTFVISGLPAELTGGTLARYSRANTGMRVTLANEFLDENGDPDRERGTNLMDRVLNAFGDDSVGELEGAHVGMENISQLCIKCIEDRRIGGSPIEQSTRYVKYDSKDRHGRWRYLHPLELKETGLEEKFTKVNDQAFELYAESIEALTGYFANHLPEDDFSIEVRRGETLERAKKSELCGDPEISAFRNAYRFTVRCAALDVARCLLPASTLTQLGIFGNGRYYTNLITYLKSHGLEEARLRGYALEKELTAVIPTFIKRNQINPKLLSCDRRMVNLVGELFRGVAPELGRITLLEPGDYLIDLAAACCYHYAEVGLDQIRSILKKMSREKVEEIVKSYIGKRDNRRDRSGRGFEAGYPFTFDFVTTFAEYRDLERHRMLTQQRQLLTTDLGFYLPSELIEVGFKEKVLVVVEAMENLYREIRQRCGRLTAQYATLFNHRVRYSMGMNLRELQHLVELRSQPSGHYGYRKIAMEMARMSEERFPWLSSALGFVDYSDKDSRIARQIEQGRIAGKNLLHDLNGSLDF